MSKICISDLHQKQIEKKNNEIKIFDSILLKCYNRIKLVAERSGQSSCFFQCPEFIFGVPMYDSYKCAKYLIKNLISEGFIVVYTHPNLFYISWDINHTRPPSNSKNRINNNDINYNNHNTNDLKINGIKNNYKQICDYKPSGNFLNNNLSTLNSNNNDPKIDDKNNDNFQDISNLIL